MAYGILATKPIDASERGHRQISMSQRWCRIETDRQGNLVIIRVKSVVFPFFRIVCDYVDIPFHLLAEISWLMFAEGEPFAG